MTPAQPPAERPSVVRRCGKPSRAGGHHPGRVGEQCEGAGASCRGPGQQPLDGDRGGEPSSQHSPQNPRRGAGYSAACQALPATGLAGITLASPVEAITTLDTARAAIHRRQTAAAVVGGQRRNLRRNGHSQPARAARPRARTRPAHRWPRQGRGPRRRRHPRCQSPHPGPAAARCRPQPLAGAHRHPAGCRHPPTRS
jgi:hypothetical protein